MLEKWSMSFPDCEPLAHQLRSVFADRWVRFHSLPESKRYPESEAEYGVVMRRHNAVLGALHQPGFSMVLLTTETAWEPGFFNPIIRRVADDVIGNVMICEADCRWIVHPYDGGMDVVLSCTDQRDRLRERFVDWLSLYPGGL